MFWLLSVKQSQCHCLSESNPSNWWRPLGNHFHSRKHGQNTQFLLQYSGHHLPETPKGPRCPPEGKHKYESIMDRWQKRTSAPFAITLTSRVEVFSAVRLRTPFFWGVTRRHCFDWLPTFRKNIGKYLTNTAASHAKRKECTMTPLLIVTTIIIIKIIIKK